MIEKQLLIVRQLAEDGIYPARARLVFDVRFLLNGNPIPIPGLGLVCHSAHA